jgi:hypothetical protein
MNNLKSNMMKQVILLNILSLIVLITGCNPNAIRKSTPEDDSHPKNLKSMNYNLHNDSDSLKNKVSMVIEPASTKSLLVGKAKLIIANHSADSLKVSEFFFLEFYNGTAWQRLSILDDILFNDIAYLIPPGQAKELPVNLQPKPINYKPGKYRICKVVQILPGNVEAVITASFLVK